MGDFVGPNRQHAVERFRRRITTYQHRQQDTAARFQAGYPDLFEQQRQETELLRQRWLENNAKKSAKQSKVKDGSGGGSGGGPAAAISQNNHRNLVTQKLKEKIDATANGDNILPPPTSTSSASNVYNFHDDQQQQQQPSNQSTADDSHSKHTYSGGGGTNISSSANVGVTGGGQDGSLPQLSVQIVQQISSERKSPQTIHTNVTVQSFPTASASNSHQPHSENGAAAPRNNSTNNISVHTSTSTHSGSYKPASNPPPSHTGSSPNSRASTGLGATSDSVSNTEINTSSSVECKAEQSSQDQFDALLNSLGSEVPELSIDELSDILGYIEKGDLEAQLNTFDKVFKNVVQADRNEGSDSLSVFSSLDGQSSPGLSKATALLVEAGHTSTRPPTSTTHPVTASQPITSTPPITASQTLTASQSISVHAPSQPHTVRAPSKPLKTSPAGGHSTALSPPTMFEAAQAMGGMTGPARFPVQSPPALAEPTGPAAETLKQMAAQHQHQSSAGSPLFSGKTLPDSLYNDNYEMLSHKRSNFPSAYTSPSYPPSGANGAGSFPGYGPNPGFIDSAQTVPFGMNPGLKPDMSGAGFNQTKPLTHFAGDSHSALSAPTANPNGQPSVPSSLQQLQKQVASQFSPPVQITQTQSVQMMQGNQRLHLSQTQQVQMAAAAQQQQHMQQQGVPQHMAGSKPKSYSMAPQMPGQVQTAAPMGASAAQATREMHMMQEKIRLGQHHQHQYMSRPPPEYKIHSARAAAAPYPTPNMTGHNSGAVRPGSGGVITPLQTMQNMVNQTPPYPGLKTETASGSATVMTQISAVQSMAMSVNGKGSHSGTTLAQASQNMTAYQQTVSQQQPLIHRTPSYSPHTRTPTPNSLTTPGSNSVSVNGGVGMGANSAVSIPHSVSVSTNPQTSNHNYTSALMRNQRPPNVNVGPDGLNISQPRVHPTHAGHMTHTTHQHLHTEGWPKSMMQGAHGTGHLVQYNPQAMQGQLGMGTMAGQVGSGGHPAMPGQLTRGGHQGMQGQLVVGVHQSMQAQIGGRVAMASSPVNPMGQGAMMPSGYSHRPGSAGSTMGGSGPMTEHSMMGGGSMGMNGAIPPSIDFPPIVPQDFYYT